MAMSENSIWMFLPVRGSGRDLKTCRSDRMRWPLRECIHLLITQSRKKYKYLILLNINNAIKGTSRIWKKQVWTQFVVAVQ